MKIEFIDQPFLLNAYSLGIESRKQIFPTILVDHRFRESVFVMVKGLKPTSNNKYEVLI